MKNINIAVDGTAGSGKSSTFLEVSKIIGYNFIDTGVMYRAFTWLCANKKIDFNNKNHINEVLKDLDILITDNKIIINGEDVSLLLESDIVIKNINKVSVVDIVRDKMVTLQKEMVKEKRNIMVGRDITSVVLCDAELKVYFDCSIEERAKRRLKQRLKINNKASYDEIYESIRQRDMTDKSREIGALKIVPDAWIFDSTNYSFQESVEKILEKIYSIIN
ncbi:(d)CMP kinase [Spiroplasma endosymbiont of Aspidapion aeneum]|uniref:(d)CMP kinase n=1 Tax=Spiroplasma endosymbiont of Aspidapion aeneum TaxID=3066276 RepID=UPI00313D3B39